MKVLGEIPPLASPPLRAGALRRRDLEAFGGLLAELDGAGVVLATGDRTRKRALALGLATTAAAAGTRTALLEADLAEPTLAEALGLARAPGLREHLRGEADAGSVLEPLALAGPGSAPAREPLVCVGAGRPGEDGAALLASDAFPRALAGLRAAYELVVVEGPPASDEGCLPLVAAEADATLLCVGASEAIPALGIPLTATVIQG